MNYIKLLTDQLIEHKQEDRNLQRFSEQEQKINESVKKILQGNVGIDKLDDVIRLREVLHFSELDTHQISEIDKKLIEISTLLNKIGNTIYGSIVKQGWDHYWKEYNEFVDFFPADHQDGALLHSVNEQLSFLAPSSKIIIKKIISETPEINRRDFFNDIVQLTDHILEGAKADILGAVAGIPSGERADVMEHAKRLFTDSMNSYDKVNILKSIAGIPSGERTNVIEHAKSLFPDDMDDFDKINILKGIVTIAPEELADVIEHAKPLFTDGMNGYSKTQILQAIAAITSKERAIVIEHAKSLFTDDMTSDGKLDILQTIAEIASEERASVIEYAKPLFIDEADGHKKASILHVIGKIRAEERVDVIKHAKPLFTDDMDGSNKADILEAVAWIFPENRVNVIEHAKPLFTDDMDADDKSAILGAITVIESEERADVIEQAKRLFTDDMNGCHKMEILQAITAIPFEERGLLIEEINVLATKFPDSFLKLSQLRLYDRIFVFYLLPTDLKTVEKLSNLEGNLLDNVEYRLAVLASLEQKIANPQPSLSNAVGLANFVKERKNDLQLHDGHPLVQRANEIIFAAGIEGAKNPFIIYKKIKELQKQATDFQPQKHDVYGIATAINLEKLRGSNIEVKITREDVPEKATLAAWNALRENLKTKIENDKDLQDALESYGTTWSLVWGSSLSDVFLSGLLSLSSEVVSFTEAKFRQILNNILDKETKKRDHSPFTEQEEVLIKAAMMIQHCSGGKQEGIDLVYSQLDTKYRYRVKLPEDTEKEAKQTRGFQFVSAVVKDFIASQFRGDNPFLMQVLTGAEEIYNGTHQAIYVKNLLAPVLGLDHDLSFDYFTGGTYDSLIENTREGMLKVFFDIVTPETLIRELKRAVNSDPYGNPVIQAASSEANTDDFLELQEDDITCHLTEKGAFTFLQRAGYVTV